MTTELCGYFVKACPAELSGAASTWPAELERKLQVLYPGARVRPQSALAVHGIDRAGCYVFRDGAVTQGSDDPSPPGKRPRSPFVSHR